MTSISKTTILQATCKITVFMACGLVFPKDVSGQYVIEALPRWMTSVHLESNIPQPPIDEFLDATDWGGRIEVQYRLQYNKPFLAGAYYGEAVLSKYVLEYDNGGTEIREKANTRRLDFGFTAGFYPEINWLLQPYVQGRVGLAIFQSSSILKDTDAGEIIDRIPEMSDNVMSYGLDLGIHIVPNIWYIRGDIRVGLVANPSVTFLSLDDENLGTTGFPIDYFKEHTSSGQWLKISMGVSYLF